jgi:hypothetical protein
MTVRTVEHIPNASSDKQILQIAPAQAKVLVCVLGVLVALVDFSVPGDVNIAIFYCLAIALCVWTRSLLWLWSATFLFVVSTFAGFGLAPSPVQAHASWVHWTNRAMTASALVLVAIFLHLHTRMVELLERSVDERKRAEAFPRPVVCAINRVPLPMNFTTVSVSASRP